MVIIDVFLSLQVMWVDLCRLRSTSLISVISSPRTGSYASVLGRLFFPFWLHFSLFNWFCFRSFCCQEFLVQWQGKRNHFEISLLTQMPMTSLFSLPLALQAKPEPSLSQIPNQAQLLPFKPSEFIFPICKCPSFFLRKHKTIHSHQCFCIF